MYRFHFFPSRLLSLGLALLAIPLAAQQSVDPAQLLDRWAEQLRPTDGPVRFAAIGDQQYGAEGERKWPALVESINSHTDQLAFVVHVGDIKNGGSPCSDAIFADRLKSFNAFQIPFILTPGDNEWTDCHRPAAGGMDPLERLTKLRATFYPDDQSLGAAKRKLIRQSEDPRYALYRENALWAEGNMLFATLHIVGSNNNNEGRNPEATAEYTARNAATLEWMRVAFTLAKRNNFAGVVLVCQADFAFPLGVGTNFTRLSGWVDSANLLETETVAFGRPVLMIHGDTHYFRFDKPMAHSGTQIPVDNFFRLEVPGEADVHWVKVDTDPSIPESPFRIQHITVRANAR